MKEIFIKLCLISVSNISAPSIYFSRLIPYILHFCPCYRAIYQYIFNQLILTAHISNASSISRQVGACNERRLNFILHIIKSFTCDIKQSAVRQRALIKIPRIFKCHRILLSRAGKVKTEYNEILKMTEAYDLSRNWYATNITFFSGHIVIDFI